MAPSSTPVATETAVPSPTPTVTNTAVPTTEGPLTVQVNADGSGDYATIQEAFAALAGGSTIELSAGEFEVEEMLERDTALTVTGAGREQTTILSRAPAAAVNYSGAGLLSFSDLTLRHEGPAAADVLKVLSGQLELADCRVEGGLREAGRTNYGAGLFLLGESVTTVSGCEFGRNDGAGVEAIQNAQINMQNSLLSGNGSGILFDGSSSGSIQDNQIAKNDGVGIYIFAQAVPEISDNVIQDNLDYGLYYQLDAQAGGSARDNELFNNKREVSSEPGTDIIVYDSFQPQLVGNTCSSDPAQALPGSGGSADASGVVFFHRGFASPSDYVPESNDCAYAVCSLSAGIEDLEMQCSNP